MNLTPAPDLVSLGGAETGRPFAAIHVRSAYAPSDHDRAHVRSGRVALRDRLRRLVVHVARE